MVSKNKVGKVYLLLFIVVKVMKLILVINLDFDWCLSIFNEGCMFMFLLCDLLSLGKGKGNKFINIFFVKL